MCHINIVNTLYARHSAHSAAAHMAHTVHYTANGFVVFFLSFIYRPDSFALSELIRFLLMVRICTMHLMSLFLLDCPRQPAIGMSVRDNNAVELVVFLTGKPLISYDFVPWIHYRMWIVFLCNAARATAATTINVYRPLLSTTHYYSSGIRCLTSSAIKLWTSTCCLCGN